MDEPVVVKPDMVSKNASVMEGIAPENIKGNEPKSARLTQLRVTVRNPSRTVSSVGAIVKGLIARLKKANPTI